MHFSFPDDIFSKNGIEVGPGGSGAIGSIRWYSENHQKADLIIEPFQVFCQFPEECIPIL